MLPRARLGEGDKPDSGSDNNLSNTSRVSSSATLEPARVSQKKGSAREPEDDNGRSEKEDENTTVSQAQVSWVICEEYTHTNNK